MRCIIEVEFIEHCKIHTQYWNSFICLYFVCVHIHVVRRQLEGIVSFLFLCESQEFNSTHQAWQQMSLPLSYFPGLVLQHFPKYKILYKHTALPIVILFVPTAAACTAWNKGSSEHTACTSASFPSTFTQQYDKLLAYLIFCVSLIICHLSTNVKYS